ncbi:MAG: hypothetical protein AB7G37_09720 [Solirubrobacteraceae bacterium]
MGSFFIDTDTGRVATGPQLRVAGVLVGTDPPPRPWHPVRGDIDATTLWHAVLRKQIRGVWLGTLTIRHGDHHSLLLRQGWTEVAVEEIAAFGPDHRATREPSPSPWSGEDHPVTEPTRG